MSSASSVPTTGRTHVVRAAPTRGNLLVAWGISAGLFAVVYVALLVITGIVLAAVAATPDDTYKAGIPGAGVGGGIQLPAWALAVSVTVSFLVAALAITRGAPGGIAWKVAELRVETADGQSAGAVRAALRPVLLAAVLIGAAMVTHALLASVLVLALVAASALLPPDRRGILEHLLGLRDTTSRLVPVED